jgi:hypothetical protein
MRRSVWVLAAVIAVGGCASGGGDASDFVSMMGGVGPTEAARIASGLAGKPLGSEGNPVRADMPAGQRAYLARLRCSDGRAPAFQRIGSMGAGPYGSIVDGYQVDCAGASPASSVVYMDMYHPGHAEAAAVPGFTIVP